MNSDDTVFMRSPLLISVHQFLLVPKMNQNELDLHKIKVNYYTLTMSNPPINSPLTYN